MEDLSSIPGLGSSPGEWKGYPLQYSGPENSMDSRPWGCKESATTEQLSLTLLDTWVRGYNTENKVWKGV